MKLIDLYFYLLYRIQIEFFYENKGGAKFLAHGMLMTWCNMVIYDCYVFFFEFYGLSTLRSEIPTRAVSIPLFLLFGLIWGIRYYKCKKNITDEFDAKYRTWHPDTRELCRIIASFVFLLPFIALYVIYKTMIWS